MFWTNNKNHKHCKSLNQHTKRYQFNMPKNKVESKLSECLVYKRKFKMVALMQENETTV